MPRFMICIRRFGGWQTNRKSCPTLNNPLVRLFTELSRFYTYSERSHSSAVADKPKTDDSMRRWLFDPRFPSARTLELREQKAAAAEAARKAEAEAQRAAMAQKSDLGEETPPSPKLAGKENAPPPLAPRKKPMFGPERQSKGEYSGKDAGAILTK